MSYIDKWIDEIKLKQIKEIEILDLTKVWEDEKTLIWKAKKVFNPSPFYPIYQYMDYYSPHILPLILLKKILNMDNLFCEEFNNKKKYYSGLRTIDKDIKRVYGALKNTQTIQSREQLVSKVSLAMIKDVASTEDLYPDHQNIVFCGGKDSLNILLIPWRKPIIVVSASPNFQLVKQFIINNQINVSEIIELHHEPSKYTEIEVLSNASLNNLNHCRWINQFMSLSVKYPHCIFWKGQLGDTFLTNNWKRYRTLKATPLDFFKGYSRLHQEFIENLWNRGAMWQGAHMSNLRLATDKLVLSIYHGKEMVKVLKEMDLTRCIDTDIRALIGDKITNKKVVYPKNNPSPPKLSREKSLSSPSYFKEIYSRVTKS